MNWFDSVHHLLMVDSFSKEWQDGVSQAGRVTVLVVSGVQGNKQNQNIWYSQCNSTLHICLTALQFLLCFQLLAPSSLRTWSSPVPYSSTSPFSTHACVGPLLPAAQGHWGEAQAPRALLAGPACGHRRVRVKCRPHSIWGRARRWLTCLRLAVPGFGRGLSPAPGPEAQHILCWGCSPLGSSIPCVLGRWAQGKGRFASPPHWAVHFHFALSLANYITDPVCQDPGQQRSGRGDEVGILSSR